MPVVMVFCIIGAFALDNTMFDVWVMLIFGAVGFFMERAGVPLGPFVIGLVLAPLGEEKLRSGLMMTAGGIEPLFTRRCRRYFWRSRRRCWCGRCWPNANSAVGPAEPSRLSRAG